MRWVIGIDVGGTNCVVGAVAADGSRVVGDHSQPTLPARGPDAVIADLVTMANRASDAGRRRPIRRPISSASASARRVRSTSPSGVVLLTPNLGWTNLPLRARLAAGLGVAAALENDANCAVQAECWVGAAQRGRNVIGLTLGTGIGGGIVIDGQLYHGASDMAGEFGHMVIDADGPLCGCGNHGCLEALRVGHEHRPPRDANCSQSGGAERAAGPRRRRPRPGHRRNWSTRRPMPAIRWPGR